MTDKNGLRRYHAAVWDRALVMQSRPPRPPAAGVSGVERR